ncbi:MAG: hydroxymethylbilane synthase [Campylobacter ureolyticus]|uniref:hydroxymethylbilane synthase n=1 Tax=Campylobacter ureolyticus TaxID=827 RepID=UPI0022B3E32D|nr:hydroxymethylbilane synthase [Campylobacter ureolyticus]MCZ6104309.1 hydroxymethylbilane synthase [Campylobacter ureolyticus]MDU4982328.1 hydroxymethylbilane synthase [Campylobacter ureolyticus]
MKKLIIASRKSALAMWQSEFIKSEIEKEHKLEVEIKSMKTKGDVILDSPLSKIGGKGLFTKELEVSMLNGESHLAVHSLKDVPMEFPDGLILGAVSKREDERDALVSEKFASIKDLPNGARVGTTSLRRQMQIKILRPDIKILPLRGNVNTRIKKLKDGEFDAIILAVAGISRIGLDKEVKHIYKFSKDEMIPAMGQGVLGIECPDNSEILSLISFIDDKKALMEITIERAFVGALEGGCQVPIGVNAEVIDDNIKINAVVGLPDGSKFIKKNIVIDKDEFKTAGKNLADEFIKEGAKELLKEAEKMANNS